MGLPVVNILDLVKVAARKAIALAFGQLAIFIGFSAACSAVVYGLYVFYTECGFVDLLNNFYIENIEIPFLNQELADVVYYCLAFDKFIEIWDEGLLVFGMFFDFMLVVIVAFVIGTSTCLVWSWMRKIGRDIAGLTK